MKQITLLEILKTKPFSFTVREIEEILDEELSKSPDEMDTDLVDICVDVLEKAYSEENGGSKPKNQKIKKFKIGKVLLAAAIVILVLSLSFSVSAKFFNIDASEKVVKFFNNHFNVNLGNANTDADGYTDNGLELISNLKEKGFENIILPDALISEDYSTKTTTFSGENIEQASIAFNSNSSDINGTIDIAKYASGNDIFVVGQVSVPDVYNQVKQIKVNGIDVLVFSDETSSYIYYIDKKIEYHISISCDFDLAVRIAETIK